jgi:hypothetical protein
MTNERQLGLWAVHQDAGKEREAASVGLRWMLAAEEGRGYDR